MLALCRILQNLVGIYDLIRLLDFFLLVLDVGHVNIVRIFLIDENIALNKLETFVIRADVNREKRGQKVKEFILIDVGTVFVGHRCNDHNSSEEISKNIIQNGVLTQYSINRK